MGLKIVIPALLADPTNWVMSAVGDPTNWDYAAPVEAMNLPEQFADEPKVVERSPVNGDQ